MDYMQKMVPLDNGRRVSIRLDLSTWELIDIVAKAKGESWREWCAASLVGVAEEDNKAAKLRQALSKTVLQASDALYEALEDRGDDLLHIDQNSLVRNSGMVSDEGLADYLKKATVMGQSYFGGFTLIFGYNDDGVDFCVIKNNLRDGVHYVMHESRI